MKVAQSCLASVLLIAVACGGGTTNVTASAPAASTSPAPMPASSSAPPILPPNIEAAVAADDRDPSDKALDAGRHPAALLAFCGIRLGAKVAEIAAGGGYTTELLARAVGPGGRVYGQNSKMILEKFAEKPWSARLAKPASKNIIRVDREFDDPLPPDATGLDVVVDSLFYHDTVWLNVDRDKMNKAILAALKPGGVYCILDHSARPGSGTNDVKTLHRIDEALVRAEVERAGFTFSDQSSAWRNDSDARDWNASPMAAKDKRGTSDRFALKFVRP